MVEYGWPEDEPHGAAGCPTTGGVAGGDGGVDDLEPSTSATVSHATIMIDDQPKQPDSTRVSDDTGCAPSLFSPNRGICVRRKEVRGTKYC